MSVFVACFCSHGGLPEKDFSQTFLIQNIASIHFGGDCKCHCAENLSFSFVCCFLFCICTQLGVDVHTIHLLWFTYRMFILFLSPKNKQTNQSVWTNNSLEEPSLEIYEMIYELCLFIQIKVVKFQQHERNNAFSNLF